MDEASLDVINGWVNEKTHEKEKGNIVDGYQEYSHCGKCWFCLERAYAFQRLV